MSQERVQYIDIASGILIVWVMLFHALNNCKVFGDVDTRVAIPFLTFSMPWFFYKSGQLFNGNRGTEGIKKDFRKFVLSFLKWSAIGYAIYLLMHLVDGTLSPQIATSDVLRTMYTYGYIPINTPTWFILSLFFVRIISHYLIKWKIPPFVCIIAGIAIGYLFHLCDTSNMPFLIANVAMGIAFFMMGFGYHTLERNRIIVTACAVGYIAFLVLGCSIVGHHRNILLAGEFLLWPVFAYCGIVTFNNLCRWISAKAPQAVLRPITFVGSRTMTLLVTHALIYAPIVYFSKLSPWATVGLIVIGYVAIFAIMFWRAKREKQIF